MAQQPKTFGTLIRALAHHLELANNVLRADTGACLIALPDELKPHCAQLTKKQCQDVGGVFVGGPCPKTKA